MSHAMMFVASRRAFMFTVVALIAAAVTISLISVHSASVTQESVHTHILSANHFLVQLEQDIPRAMFITGYRGLIGLEEHVSATGMYLNNISSLFIEVVTNGSINGTAYEVMDDATLQDFEARMQAIAGQMGFDLRLTFTNASIAHTSPFVVAMNATVEVAMATRDDNTHWNFSTQVSGEFGIDQLKDPLYTIGTLGRVPVTIAQSNVSQPYIDASNDTTNLQLLWNQSMYVPDDDAPSFLMRFVGNFSASEHGIASLVDTKTLDSQDLPVLVDRSVVDHLYFGNSSTSTNSIVNMPVEFVLDDDHLDLFDAVGKTT